jgi:hypothetical protein
MMEKFLCHPTVNGWLPPYLVHIAKLKQSQHILGNLKDGLTSHLVSQQQFKRWTDISSCGYSFQFWTCMCFLLRMLDILVLPVGYYSKVFIVNLGCLCY